MFNQIYPIFSILRKIYHKSHLILSRSAQSSYFVAAALFAASPEKKEDLKNFNAALFQR